MDGTILGQGRFTVGATVANQVIAIPSNADWVKVFNYTQFGTDGGASANGVEFYWQRGMAAATGIVKYKINTVNGKVLQGDTLTAGGFTLYDPSATPSLSAAVAITDISNVTRPVVLTANTTGVAVGTIVRLYTSAAANSPYDILGQDWVVGAVTPNVSFTLLNATSALATAPGAGGAVTGTYRIVNYPPLFYPRKLVITNITPATGTIATATPHGLTPGQSVRFNIPAVSGSVQLNYNAATNTNTYTVATISATDQNVFTVSEDISTVTAFTFPTSAQMPTSFPEVTPAGENTGFALTSATLQIPGVSSATLGSQIYNSNTGILADSTVNTGFLGMILGTGGAGNAAGGVVITGPAGTAAADVMYWVAGKSSFGGL